MQRLYLVRHAESLLANTSYTDYERPLNQVGIQDAHEIGKYLKTKKYIPECILTSAAKRTVETSKILHENLSVKSLNIIKKSSLYGASINETLEIIGTIQSTYSSLMIVGHNPTVTLMVNQISDATIDYVPTSGIAIIDFNASDYTDLKGSLIEFIYPKKLKLL